MDQPWVYVVLLGILCLVISWFMKEPNHAAVTTKDIEDAMDLVAANLEEENKSLLNSLANLKSDYAKQAEKLELRVHELDKRVGELSSELREQRQLLNKPAPTPPYQAVASESPAANDVQEPEVSATISQRYPEIFQLYKQGKSIDSIARKLGMNKGEVALILQLSKREDESHV